MGADAYRSALVAGAESLGLRIAPDLADAMSLHFSLVVKWAARINLTAITDPVEGAHLHGLDSLLFAEVLGPTDSLAGLSAVDVGSGAGFPGLVVALARPAMKMTLLEPIRKRASFLRVALSELARPDVAVVEGKLKAGPKGNLASWPADVILSRATLPPPELIALAADRLASNGRLILSGGRGAPSEEEIATAASGTGLIHRARRTFTLPGGELRVLDTLAKS
jgi:16S rRNA (guanine527-N7)-methyltransferase